MKKRRPLGFALGVLSLAWAASCRAAPLPKTPVRPDVVYILADDLGWADVGFNGGAIPTPHLDRLAREGVVLSRHYVAPVCTPSRAGLITGRYWSRFGVFFVQATQALPFDVVTLPAALKSAGYDTALIGKWHLGSTLAWGPNHFGFDYSYGSLGGGVGPFDHSYKRGPYRRTWHRDNQLIDEEGHVTDLLGDEAVRWIEARGSRPFFLYLPFTAPHLPVKEPRAWLDHVPDAVVREVQRRFAATVLPPFAVPGGRLSDELARHYAACVMHLDAAVGRVVDALERTGKRQNTLIIFTSDNGSPTGVENNDPDYPDGQYPSGPIPGANHPLRGFKTQLYDGGTRVPALANWPGVLEPRTVTQPVDIVDWMPTLCALAGYTSNTDLKWDGRDIWPLLTGQSKGDDKRPFYTGYATGSSLREGLWKLIVMKPDEHRTGTTELYDLARDPDESANLAATHATKVNALKQALAEAQKNDGDAVVPASDTTSSPVVEHVRK